MNKKTKIILLLTLILIVSFLLFISGFSLIRDDNSNSSVSDKSVSEDMEINRTWTKAICNSDNYCGDYEISCHNDIFISMKPTGSAVHFSDNWKDPRQENEINRLC